MLVLVDRVHRQQAEPVADLAGQRHAQVAGGVADHERDQFGRGLLGGEDQVALVLAVLVVDDDDRLARRDVGDRALDAVQPRHGRSLLQSAGERRAALLPCTSSMNQPVFHAHRPATDRQPVRRSTYFAECAQVNGVLACETLHVGSACGHTYSDRDHSCDRLHVPTTSDPGAPMGGPRSAPAPPAHGLAR